MTEQNDRLVEELDRGLQLLSSDIKLVMYESDDKIRDRRIDVEDEEMYAFLTENENPDLKTAATKFKEWLEKKFSDDEG